MASAGAGATATHDSTAAGHPIARVLPLLSPAHLDRDFDYLVPLELDEIAQPGVRVRIRFAGRLVDGYLLARLSHSDHTGKMVKLERVVSAERVLTPEILKLATAVAARYAGTRADVLRLAIPPRHARTENGGSKKSAEPEGPQEDSTESTDDGSGRSASRTTQAAPSRGRARASGTLHAPLDSDLADDFAASVDTVAALDHSVDAPTVAGEDEAVDVRDRFPTAAPVPSRSADHVMAAGAGSESLSADSVESVADSGAVTSAAQDGAGSVAAAHGRGEAESEGADAAVGERAVVAAESANVAAVLADSGDTGLPDGGELRPWERYIHGAAFVSALGQGKGVRAGWQAVPGEDWPRRLAELAAVVVGRGRSAILMVPDQRDLDRVLAECVRLVGDSAVGLAAGLGPAARYRRWLAALRGTARVIVGTRSAVFAPAVDLGLIAIWDDGDDTYAEPRAPYSHAREVAMLRAHEAGAAFVAAGFARTAEIQAVVDSGWAHDLVADRAVVRKFSPRISAPGDSDIAMERDPVARAVRIPAVGYAAARSALNEGAAVLVQVPRRGYIPALACAKCRTPARCRHCNGPLSLPDGRAGHRGETAHSPACRWCGITEAAFRCPACASRALRAVVIGAVRTAEELGRAFPGVPIRGSSGGAVLDTVEPGPQVIVATVGAEPVLRGGYGVALLLDGWALLSRADLRAAEDTLRRWMSAATLVRNHGQVIVMAEPSLPTVQALLRWDPVGHARAEVASRAEVGFPPAVRMAAIDGTPDSISELLSAAKLPDNVNLLGPVPLPPGARKPFDSGDTPAEVERMLLRVDRTSGAALARALTAAQAVRSTHRSDAPLRVQIDPVDIG
ncbi:primosomal protein N' [Nocardia vinacea]|uniref:primosomal protein N' n=1 Tax=Nocardia vinacea TaxID=96468 RepID=UPI002E154A5E|nr:primosomal protein N' [Nocardia vinacea]